MRKLCSDRPVLTNVMNDEERPCWKKMDEILSW